MADHAALAQRLVLIDKWPALLGVAIKASFVAAQESDAASLERLLQIRSAAVHCTSLVRVVTIGAIHFAFQHRMVMRHLKLCPHFQVTFETCFGRLARIDNRVCRAGGLNVQAPRAVAALAAHWLCVFAFRHKPGVRGRFEISGDLAMAGIACIRAHELCARNARRRNNGAIRIERAARKQNHGQRDCSPCTPTQLFAFTVQPSSYSPVQHDARFLARGTKFLQRISSLFFARPYP